MANHASLLTMTGVSALPLGSLVGLIDVVRAFALGKKNERVSTAPVFMDRMPKVQAASDSVLAAENRADLVDRLDGMFIGLGEFGGELETMKEPEIDGEDALKQVLGVMPASEIQKAADQALPRLEALATTLSILRITGQEPMDWSQMVDVAYDSSVPLAGREIFMEVVHGILATVVILRAVEVGRRLEPWLAMALAKIVAGGIEKGTDGVCTLLPLMQEGTSEKTLDRFASHFEKARHYVGYLESFYPDEQIAEA